MSSSVQRAVSLRSTAKWCCGNLPEGLRRYDTRFASAGFSRRFAPQNDKKILAKTENLININYPDSQNFMKTLSLKAENFMKTLPLKAENLIIKYKS